MGSNGSKFINRITDDIDSLAIALAKAGFDVWLGNNRGNYFSSEHEKLDWLEDEASYWKFSFKEMGEYDLPAMLTTVQEETGGKKIKYLGTSLGTTQMFYGLQSPVSKEILDGVLELVIAMAPITIANIEETFPVSMFKYNAYMEVLAVFDMSH